jgi:CRISPR-associated protein Csm2
MNVNEKKRLGFTVADEIKEKIEAKKDTLSKSLTADELVEYAEKMGKYLRAMYLKTSQIRKILDAVNKIKATTDYQKFNREELVLLKPKLAYAAGKQEQQVKPLMNVLLPCIDKVKTYPDFKKFAQFLEAIIAYHKYYGGKEM